MTNCSPGMIYYCLSVVDAISLHASNCTLNMFFLKGKPVKSNLLHQFLNDLNDDLMASTFF